MPLPARAFASSCVVAPITGAVVAVSLVDVAPIPTLKVGVVVAPGLAISFAAARSLDAEGAAFGVRVGVGQHDRRSGRAPDAATVAAVGGVGVAPRPADLVVIFGAPRCAVRITTARALGAKTFGADRRRHRRLHGRTCRSRGWRLAPVAITVAAVRSVDVAPRSAYLVVIFGAPRCTVRITTARSLGTKALSASPREESNEENESSTKGHLNLVNSVLYGEMDRDLA